MPGDASKRSGIKIVDLTDERAAAPRVPLDGERRCDPFRMRRIRRELERIVGVVKHLVGTAQCLADSVELRSERTAAAIGGYEAEQDEVQIAVDRFGARLVLERHRADVVLELPARRRRGVEQTRGQAGSVLEQVLHRHLLAVAPAPFSEEITHTRVEPQTSIVDQL